MRALFNRLMAIATTVTFILAMSVQAAPSAEALGLSTSVGTSSADEHCPRMAADHPGTGMPKQMPCKGIMPDCVKQMGCIGSPNLPSRIAELQTSASYSSVIYWPLTERRAGIATRPDLLPPRTI